MNKAFISIFAFLLATTLSSSHDGTKDGFNYYKDYLRGGRSDDSIEPEPATAERMLYFYRTPLQLYPEISPLVLEQEYRKRTGNTFKNHMLSKESLADREPMLKSSSKAAMSLIMAHLHNLYERKGLLPNDSLEISAE